MRLLFALSLLLIAAPALAQSEPDVALSDPDVALSDPDVALALSQSQPAFTLPQPGPDVLPFITVNSPVFVLDHVLVIDGTGAPAKADQSIVIANGNIQSIGPASSIQAPPGAQRLDRTGYSVIPASSACITTCITPTPSACR